MKALFLLLTLISSTGFSLDSKPESDFLMDKNLVNKLYDESVTASHVEDHVSSGIALRPMLTYVTPTRLKLSNNYFTVPYSDNLTSMAAFRIEAGGLLTHAAGFELSLLGSLGYSYKESTQSVYSVSGSKFSDLVKFHWLPVAAGPRLDYKIPGFSYVKPTISAAIGAQWLYQTGKLDGLEQGFWIPFYQISGGLVFFEGQSRQAQWFGGVETRLTTQKGFGSTQNFDAWSIDAGVTFHL